MKTVFSFLKWVVPIIILAILGLYLISRSNQQEKEYLLGYETYNNAIKALGDGNYEEAYTLYIKSATEFTDPKLKAIALYEAATLGFNAQIGDYYSWVDLYQRALKYYPGFDEAAFDLEYLYWLKTNSPEKVPPPQPGPEPSIEEEPTYGDI